MKKDKFKELCQGIFNKQLAILSAKDDYTAASSDDKLGNFKRVSAICKILGVDFSHPSDAAMFLIILKIDREMQLKKSGKDPNCESRDDTLLDLSNYVLLYTGLTKEE